MRLSPMLVVMTALAAATVSVPALPAQAAIPDKPARTWGTDGRVNIILPVGGRIVLGGSFTAVVDTAGVSHPSTNLAVLDPATGAPDPAWKGYANDTVTTLTASPDATVIYIGGSFSKVDGIPRARLAALSATDGSVTPWAPKADTLVDALAVSGNDVFAAGLFSSIEDAGGVHPRGYVAKLSAATGALDTDWVPTPNDRVRALAVGAGGASVFLGGDFTSVGGLSATNKVAAVAAATGLISTTFKSVANNNNRSYATVYDLATSGSTLLEAVGGGGGSCTAVDTDSGALRWADHSNGNMQSVRLVDATAYCGGHFGGSTSFAGYTRHKVAAVRLTDGGVLPFAPVVNSALGTWAVGVDSSHVYLGGDFTSVTGVPQQHLAIFTDSAAQSVPLPPALRATAGDGVVDLAWSPPSTDGGSGVTKYRIYRRLAGGSWSLRPLTSLPGTSRSYADATVTNDVAYDYAVSASNTLGEGPWATVLGVTPHIVVPAPPAAPTGFSAVAGSGLVDLSWSTPSDVGTAPVSGYRVSRGPSPGTESPLVTLGTTTSYADREIVAGAKYYYTVTALNAVGEGPSAPEQSATPTAGRPGVPTDLAAAASGGVVHLTWSAPAYDGGSEVTKYSVVRDAVRIATISSVLTYDDSTAAPGVTHDYQVRAVNAVGAGTLSTAVSISP